eukprot:EG_transcript_9249
MDALPLPAEPAGPVGRFHHPAGAVLAAVAVVACLVLALTPCDGHRGIQHSITLPRPAHRPAVFLGGYAGVHYRSLPSVVPARSRESSVQRWPQPDRAGAGRPRSEVRDAAAASDPAYGRPPAWKWPMAAGLAAFAAATALNGGVTLTGLGFTGSLLASVAGAAVATTVLHPVNTIKTRIQVGLPPVDPVKGLPGLYRGLLFGLASDLPTESIAMATSVLFKEVFVTWQGSSIADHTHAMLFLFSIWSGALGTLVSSFVEAPSEMLMKQMQTKQSRGTMQLVLMPPSPRCGSARGMVFLDRDQALRTVFCSPGSGSRLLNSWLVLLSRELPFGSFQFAFYEASMLAFTHFLRPSLTVNALISGALAGALSMVICAPFDVLVSRVMSEDENDDAQVEKAHEPRNWQHVVDIVRQIWRDEGLAGFWKGTGAGTVYYGLWACLFFAVYEVIAAVIV